MFLTNNWYKMKIFMWKCEDNNSTCNKMLLALNTDSTSWKVLQFFLESPGFSKFKGYSNRNVWFNGGIWKSGEVGGDGNWKKFAAPAPEIAAIGVGGSGVRIGVSGPRYWMLAKSGVIIAAPAANGEIIPLPGSWIGWIWFAKSGDISGIAGGGDKIGLDGE